MNMFFLMDNNKFLLPEPRLDLLNAKLPPYDPWTENGYLICERPDDLAYYTMVSSPMGIENLANPDEENASRTFYLITAKGYVIQRTLKFGKKPNTYREYQNIFKIDMGLKMVFTENEHFSSMLNALLEKDLPLEEFDAFVSEKYCHNKKMNVLTHKKIAKKLLKKCPDGTLLLPAPKVFGDL